MSGVELHSVPTMGAISGYLGPAWRNGVGPARPAEADVTKDELSVPGLSDYRSWPDPECSLPGNHLDQLRIDKYPDRTTDSSSANAVQRCQVVFGGQL